MEEDLETLPLEERRSSCVNFSSASGPNSGTETQTEVQGPLRSGRKAYMDAKWLVRAVVLASATSLAACANMARRENVDYRAVVASPDRSEADRQTDQRRNPELLLAFAGARPGMRVLDMGAGGGYSTELLARTVGSGGTVYAQDSEAVSPGAKERFDGRAQTPAMRNVVRVLRDYDDPVPPAARDLDLITFFFAYHDTAFMSVDRAKMNRGLFEALRPGGALVVADHSAQAGAGV